jgi:hypothetical protein
LSYVFLGSHKAGKIVIFQKLFNVLGREVKPEPSEAGADDELDLEDTTTTSSSLELPMFFLQVRKKPLKKVVPIRIRIILVSRIRFRIRVKSRIRNRIKFKTRQQWRLKNGR